MNKKILLSDAKAKYEPHIMLSEQLPFIYHIDMLPEDGPLNFHENLELLFVLEGNGSIRCDDQIYEVNVGDLIVVNSYSVHQVFFSSNLTYACLIISRRFCLKNDIDTNVLYFTPAIHDKTIINHFENIIHEYTNNGSFRNTGIKAAVLATLLHLCRNYISVRKGPAIFSDISFKSIQLAIDYIKKNFNQNPTLEEIAAHAGLSKYYFSREFKRITGHTVIQYTNIFKCEFAQALLQNPSCSLKEIAISCGFENYSYFAKVFKEYTNMLPSEYIKKNTHSQ